jgi:hypothetical protein
MSWPLRILVAGLTGVTGLAGAWWVITHVPIPPDQVIATKIRNDGPAAVRIDLCEDDACRHLASGGAVVRPGSAFLQNISPGVDETFLVRSPAGSPPTCRVLRVGSTMKNEYPLSVLTTCGH